MLNSKNEETLVICLPGMSLLCLELLTRTDEWAESTAFEYCDRTFCPCSPFYCKAKKMYEWFLLLKWLEWCRFNVENVVVEF